MTWILVRAYDHWVLTRSEHKRKTFAVEGTKKEEICMANYWTIGANEAWPKILERCGLIEVSPGVNLGVKTSLKAWKIRGNPENRNLI